MHFILFNPFKPLYLNLLLHVYDMTSHYFISFAEYHPEDGRKTPKHIGLPHVGRLLCLITVQLLEYIT